MTDLMTVQEVMAWYRRRGAGPVTEDEVAEMEADAEVDGATGEDPGDVEAEGAGSEGADEPNEGGNPRDGYSVEARKGGWHALIGPDGKQIGSSQRTEADAWALLEG
jgi:hypothetical protein